jgi:hypothetical protein
MTRNHVASAVAVAACLLGTSHVARAAQESGTPAQRPAAAAVQNEPEGAAQSLQAPVLHITSVEVIRSTHAPVMDIIRVRGLTSTSGWEEAELIPLTRGVPQNGVLEMMLVARAPSEAVEASGFEVIEAIFPLEPDHPFKGVNVHSASESVSVGALPGYTERQRPAEDCGHCVGKIFVPKGSAAPAGKAAAELVREEQLPAGTRVIRPTDGIASADSNPNRLTLVLTEQGRIATAIWD